jgi:uncharacterized protein
MIVKIDEIRDRGLHLEEPVPVELVRAALEDAVGAEFRSERGFRLVADLQRVGSGVLLEGRFTAEVFASCGRCAADVPLTLPIAFTLNLVPRSTGGDEDAEDESGDDEQTERAGSFRLDDAEQETFDGKQIDLDPILREQLLLALPMNALCREDCKGLCGTCGQDLNERACGCDPRVPDPRLAALKHVKLN